ncbi:hypothetical protein GXW82_13780 [Streptacidiphilus sp. 4-A2]|nr:hypothetical protein [Streptacidiphilus sp. 4-A2]
MSRTGSTLAAISLAAAATVLSVPAAQAATPQLQNGAVASYCDNHPDKCDGLHGGVGAGEGGSQVSASPTEIGLGTSLAVIGVGGAVFAWRRRLPASARV